MTSANSKAVRRLVLYEMMRLIRSLHAADKSFFLGSVCWMAMCPAVRELTARRRHFSGNAVCSSGKAGRAWRQTVWRAGGADRGFFWSLSLISLRFSPPG